MTDEVLGPPVL